MFLCPSTRSTLSSRTWLRNILNVYGYDAAKFVTAVSSGKMECPELANAKPYEEMPRIPILPFIGSSWAYFPIIGRYSIGMIHKSDSHKYEVYGDIVRERFGQLELVSVFTPEAIEMVYRHEGHYPTRGEFQTIKIYRESRKEWYKSTGLMILEGEEWADLRRKTQKHLMKPRSIQAYLNPMQDVARDFVKRMTELQDSNKEVPMFLEELNKWALESIAYVGLDTRLGCFSKNVTQHSDSKKMIDSVQTMFDYILKLEPIAGNIPFWKYLPSKKWKTFANASDDFTKLTFKYINRSLDELKKNADSDKYPTLLQSMILTKGLDASGAMVMVADMLFGGIDSTSHTVGFLLYRLGKNPEKQEKLYNEIKELLPNKNDRITPEIFQKFHYLKACLKESIRTDPVFRGMPRVLDHDVAISGYRIPAGVTILCGLQVMYGDKKYFKDPNKFLPERWLDRNKDINPFSFLPFGIGTRSCVGRRLAELEMICITAEIIRNFRLEYHYEDIGMKTRMLNIPDKPLRLTFLER